MTRIENHKMRTAYKPRAQGICPCGEKFLKKSTGVYCNRCKVLRMTASGRKHYEELIKP